MSIDDTLIRRQVFIQRFAGSEAVKTEELLMRIYAEVQARILREPTEYQAARLARLRTDLEIIMGRGFEGLTTEITGGIAEFAEDELSFTMRAMQLETDVILNLPAAAQVDRALMTLGLDVPVGPNQLTMSEALQQFTTNKMQEIRLVIGDGVLLGDTTTQIAQRVAKLAGGRPRHQVNALVRTLINHATASARKVFAEQNKHILDGEEWVATLDSRTTLICGGRDGRRYPVGKGPYPPAHWNCRSLRVPIIKEEFDIEPDKSASNKDFDSWLRSQSADFQDNYFSQFPDGLEKAKLFRVGELPIQRFRDETGRNFTLKQLQSLEPVTFSRANITPPKARAPI